MAYGEGGTMKLSQRTYTIAPGRGEWVILDGEGRRITGFPLLGSAVSCVVALLEGRFDR